MCTQPLPLSISRLKALLACGLARRPRPCGDGALWEIWAAGASHAGGSAPSGHSAAAVPAGDDGRGISVLWLFQPGPGGTGETTLKKKIYGRAHLKCGRRHPVPRVPIASGGAPECRPSTLDTPPRAAARHPDGCGATARNTSLVRPTGSPHRWVSSLRRPRAPQRRVRASWPRLASEQGCLRAARPGVLALGVLAPRTFVCAHEGTGSSHRWVSSLRFPRAPQRRVRASWPRLVPE